MNLPTKQVSLREMVLAMGHMADDEVFRWFQDSEVIPSHGWHRPTVTMVVTMGQVRQELEIEMEGFCV